MQAAGQAGIEHDEHAAYLVLESVLGIAWEIPAGNPQKNSCIEYGFAQAMAVAMMLRLREPLMSPPRCMSFSARLMPSGRWWSMVLGRHRRR